MSQGSDWNYKAPLNGGLYTGEPFLKDAPWRNFPAVPSAAYMTNVNLRSANPPPQALFFMAASIRPGNNSDNQLPGIAKFTGDKNFGPFSSILCMPCIKKVECSCGYDCECKELCSDNKVGSCPCKSSACPTKWVQID